MTPNPFLDAALDYARRGLAVIPLHWPENGGCSCKEKAKCGTPGKHPRWHEADLPNGVHSATTDEKIIRRWWQRWPKANVGIATGRVSGLIVVDIDPRNGGYKSLKRLPGNLPITPTSRTGGKGEHYSLKYPDNGHAVKNDTDFAGFPGIDIKSDGGFIVAPPSRHISGDNYYWKINLETPFAPTPNWLLELIKKEGTPERKAAPGGEEIPKGKRVKTLRSLAGTMRRRGMNEPAILAALEAINQTQCEEPLPDSKIKDIARSYGKYEPGEITGKGIKPAPPTIQFVTGQELQSIEFKEPAWVVPGILPEGLCLLSARPKKGKTWFALNVSVAASTGGCSLGKSDLRVTQGKVLYLALEDKLRRTKKRLEIILGDAPFPEDLILAENWPRLDKGGLEALQEFLKEHSDCRLVVVDSYSRIKPTRPKNSDPYDFDMAWGGILQSLAQERQVCLLLIYHNRKAESDDPLDDVIGSTGLTGAVDAVLILRRGRGKADGTLLVTGRDVEEQELALKFHPGEGLWELMGDVAEYGMSQERQEILSILRNLGPKTPAQVTIPGKTKDAIRVNLTRMKNAGILGLNENGEYYII
jgi:hypothetical protein